MHNINDLDCIIHQLLLDLEAVRTSHVAPLQKLHAIRVIIQSAFTCALRASDLKKKTFKDYCCTLLRTSTTPVYHLCGVHPGPAFQDPSNEEDIQCNVQKLKILSSSMLMNSFIARTELRTVVRRFTSSNPLANLIC